MNSPHVIESATPELVRVVQVTDCHVYAAADARLHDINTRASLRAVLDLVRLRDPDADLVLATGDLSQDGSAESYRYLAAEFDQLGSPVVWIPGNHDDPTAMAQNLVSPNILPARRVLASNWQILLLDSTLTGQVHGRVTQQQLDFLEAGLDEYPQHHALVCLHHQALEMDSRWIDQKGLQEADRLFDLVRARANVRAVLWGHVHQESHRHGNGIEWLSTPSTCVQFKPGAAEYSLDPVAPGYRSLTLHRDGRIESLVHRATDYDQRVELDGEAY